MSEDRRYQLNRDRVNPMQLVKTKPCTRCNEVKPNNLSYFGPKLWRSRTEKTTTDVCKACTSKRVSDNRNAQVKAGQAFLKDKDEANWALMLKCNAEHEAKVIAELNAKDLESGSK